jgi:hypothetical protein
MSENRLRNMIGLLLILIHFFILALIFMMFLNGGYRYDEFTTSVAIIAPMFAGYTTAIVIHFSRNRFDVQDESKKITFIFAVLSAGFPVMFFISLFTCIVLFSYGQVFDDFEQYKGTLTLLEGLFAAYVANFVYTLFEKQKVESDRETQVMPPPASD